MTYSSNLAIVVLSYGFCKDNSLADSTIEAIV